MLFKPYYGNSSNLPTELVAGHCYWTIDTQEFYADLVDKDGNLVRQQLNSNEAKKLTGYTISEILNDSNAELPTSKAVMDAISAHTSDTTIHITSDERTLWTSKQSALTGTEGQLVGFDTDGKAVAQDVTFVNYNEPQTLTTAQQSQARTNINTFDVPTDDAIIETLIEFDYAPFVSTEDGSVLTDDTGNILLT